MLDIDSIDLFCASLSKEDLEELKKQEVVPVEIEDKQSKNKPKDFKKLTEFKP